MRGARLALVNQTLARQYWPKGSAIGQQLRAPVLKAQPPYNLAVPDSDGWLQIIGVVADARDDGLRKPVKPAIHVPFTISMRMFTQILVRSVVSHAVVRRTNEFGIRMALGAQPGHVLRLVFASTAASVGAGVAAGVILSVILARIFAAWTQETSRDPLILVAVILLLSGAAAAACLFPARRVFSIDPMTALRYE